MSDFTPPPGAPVIIVCTDLADKGRLRPSHIPAPRPCKICDEPLQMSPQGLEQLHQYPKAWLVCNPCALALMEMHKARGHDIQVAVNEEAKKTAASGHADGNPLTEVVRKHGEGK